MTDKAQRTAEFQVEDLEVAIDPAGIMSGEGSVRILNISLWPRGGISPEVVEASS